MQTDINQVQDQIQKWWSPRFVPALRQSNLLIGQVDRSYEGEIREAGDTVKINQMADVNGQLLTIGTDADTFDSELINMSQIELTCNKRAVAAVEITDLADLQSQVDSDNSAIRDSLMYAISKQINTYLYSLLVPSTSSPDHALTTTDFNAATLSTARLTAAKAKWSMGEPWFMNLDPTYYSDVIDDTTLASADYGAQDRPMIGGQLSLPRMGFQIFEDNSLGTDIGYAFVPSALLLAVQRSARFKLSDLHAQGKFAAKLSVDLVFGAKLNHDGSEKCIKWTAS